MRTENKMHCSNSCSSCSTYLVSLARTNRFLVYRYFGSCSYICYRPTKAISKKTSGELKVS